MDENLSGRPSLRYAAPPDLSRFAWWSIGAAGLTIGLKTGAAVLTGSVGLLSDAAESLVNLVAAVVALIALKVSIRPPDERHPYGHSKAEYFSAAVEGVMVFLAAALIIVTAVERLIRPRLPEQLGTGLVISVIASLINGGVGALLIRKGRQYDSATLAADGKHLMTDVVTSAAVLVGVGLVAITRQPLLDPIVALLAGLNILWTGFILIRDSVSGLMDTALDSAVSERLNRVLAARRQPGRIDFHAGRTRQAGNRKFMDLHVLVPGHWDVQRGHDLTEQIIDDLVAAVPGLRVSAHIEPIEDPKSYSDELDF